MKKTTNPGSLWLEKSAPSTMIAIGLQSPKYTNHRFRKLTIDIRKDLPFSKEIVKGLLPNKAKITGKNGILLSQFVECLVVMV